MSRNQRSISSGSDSDEEPVRNNRSPPNRTPSPLRRNNNRRVIEETSSDDDSDEEPVRNNRSPPRRRISSGSDDDSDEEPVRNSRFGSPNNRNEDIQESGSDNEQVRNNRSPNNRNNDRRGLWESISDDSDEEPVRNNRSPPSRNQRISSDSDEEPVRNNRSPPSRNQRISSDSNDDSYEEEDIDLDEYYVFPEIIIGALNDETCKKYISLEFIDSKKLGGLRSYKKLEYDRNRKSGSFYSNNLIKNSAFQKTKLPNTFTINIKKESIVTKEDLISIPYYYLGNEIFYDAIDKLFYRMDSDKDMNLLDIDDIIEKLFVFGDRTRIFIQLVLFFDFNDYFLEYIKINIQQLLSKFQVTKGFVQFNKLLAYVALDMSKDKLDISYIESNIDMFCYVKSFRENTGYYEKDEYSEFYEMSGKVFEYFGNVKYSTFVKYVSNENLKQFQKNPFVVFKEEEVIKKFLLYTRSIEIKKQELLDMSYNLYSLIHEINTSETIVEKIFNMLVSKTISIKELAVIFPRRDFKNKMPIFLYIFDEYLSGFYDYEEVIPNNILKNIEALAILHMYRVKELKKYNVSVAYDTRKSIFDLFIGQEGIFVPLKDRKCNPQLDKDGIDLNSKEDSEFVFAIGTLDNYQCYEFNTVKTIMEVNNGFYYDYDIVEGREVYKKMTIDQAKQLVIFIKKSEYPEKEKFKILLKGYIKRENISYLQNFQQLKKNEQILIKDFLYGMFYLGMLVRRWNPDDKSYPMKSKGTDHRDKGISENAMSVILTENYSLFKENIFNELKNNKDINEIIKLLSTQDKYNGVIEEEIYNTGKSIFTLIDRIFERNADLCQRIGSNMLIITAYYYLEEIFNEKISGFDIKKFENIS